MNLRKAFLATVFSFMVSLSAQVMADDYQQLFLSYMSPNDVQSLSDYVNKNQLAGYIMWDVRGDLDPQADPYESLLYPLSSDSQSGKLINVYWTNWSVYGASAIPYKPYRIPGSYSSTSIKASNDDLEHKLQIANGLVYSFLEAETSGDGLGTIYFNDPWADLTPSDSFCLDEATSASCSYTIKSGKTFKESSFMGNFEAFSQLTQAHPNLRLLMAIGGYGHDDTFEKIFSSSNGIKRFVSSAAAIMNHYGVHGIDLDYENPAMSHAQSHQYLRLINALNDALSDDQFIAVTTLAGQDYLNGTMNASHVGFDSGVLSAIAALSHVQSIDLMTYDFHGAFDYNLRETGRTGLLSNVYTPTSLPSGYDAQFSVDQSVQALIAMGVNSNKIIVGIPAYGRSLAGVPAGVDGTGLFQVIPGAATIPRGDLDDPSCSTALPVTASGCSGAFTYQYIVKHMLAGANSFSVTDWSNNAANSFHATSAYAASWSADQEASHTLTIENTGSTYGIVVKVGGFQSDYLAHSVSKVYDLNSNPSILDIDAQLNLSVSWSTYLGGPTGVCSSIDLTQNESISVNSSTGSCQIN